MSDVTVRVELMLLCRFSCLMVYRVGARHIEQGLEIFINYFFNEIIFMKILKPQYEFFDEIFKTDH